jgi:cation diffusion facilitator family transporter
MATVINKPAGPTTLSVQRLAAGSILVGLAVLGLKYAAYALTGSVALYSDALESIINVITAIAAFVAIRVSAIPADANHPYGHTKAEYFSTVTEGVLILIAAVAILREAYHGVRDPRPLDAPMLGLAVNGAATGLNAVWGSLLIRRGKRSLSPALIADGRHLMTDVYTSGGVLVGVALVAITRWNVLDSILAGLVAVQILWTGWSLMKESVGVLMDAALPEKEVEQIRSIIHDAKGEASDIRALRTRHAGRLTFIDFVLLVPGEMSVTKAHDLCDAIEKALLARIEGASITIHLEPSQPVSGARRSPGPGRAGEVDP